MITEKTAIKYAKELCKYLVKICSTKDSLNGDRCEDSCAECPYNYDSIERFIEMHHRNNNN